MTGVRWRADTGFEGKCDVCLEWWPLADTTCWSPSSGMKRCRACLAELTAERFRIRRQNPEKRAADREGVRAARAAMSSMADDRRAYYRDLYRKHRDRINARARERYAARQKNEATLVRKREWMRAFRERQRAIADEMAAVIPLPIPLSPNGTPRTNERYGLVMDAPLWENTHDGMSVTIDQFDTVRAAPAISSSLICGRRSFQEDES